MDGDEDALAVGKHLPHLVHVEDEGRVGAVHSLGERRRVELDDVIGLDLDTGSIGRIDGLVGVAMSFHVGLQRPPRDVVCRDVVRHEGHQDAHRDSALRPRFGLDEVFQKRENISQLAWPSWSPRGLLAIRELLLDAGHQALGHAQDHGDLGLGDAMSRPPREHSGNLDTPGLCPEVPVTNLEGQVGHSHPSWLLEGVDPPQDLSQGHGRQASLRSFFDGRGVGRR